MDRRALAEKMASPAAAPLLARAEANNRAIARLARGFRRDRLDAWRAATPALTSYIGRVAHLIGFPRSGATLLEQRLDAHPGLVASPERPVFPRDALPALCRAGGGPLIPALVGGGSRGLSRSALA